MLTKSTCSQQSKHFTGWIEQRTNSCYSQDLTPFPKYFKILSWASLSHTTYFLLHKLSWLRCSYKVLSGPSRSHTQDQEIKHPSLNCLFIYSLNVRVHIFLSEGETEAHSPNEDCSACHWQVSELFTENWFWSLLLSLWAWMSASSNEKFGSKYLRNGLKHPVHVQQAWL